MDALQGDGRVQEERGDGMSDILIKGMEMPNVCAYCFIDSSECKLHSSVNIWRERHPNCPLIELPPHGRLGDLDELYKVANMADDFGADTLDMLKLIADTPTVIEAEE